MSNLYFKNHARRSLSLGDINDDQFSSFESVDASLSSLSAPHVSIIHANSRFRGPSLMSCHDSRIQEFIPKGANFLPTDSDESDKAEKEEPFFCISWHYTTTATHVSPRVGRDCSFQSNCSITVDDLDDLDELGVSLAPLDRALNVRRHSSSVSRKQQRESDPILAGFVYQRLCTFSRNL
ncbi:expressed unknown protein [Seminavis robusta]|uniref:Uncharacterized protein n=1 Tax=Seminavis robusta TaxID=568900 RepID=A0A9N8DDC1_9STRA|nr:expressed unknown protein [Seminavis robusta]|eukprot:Sro38_g023560.1 n/a (180) ;mRNA; r:12789-13328